MAGFAISEFFDFRNFSIRDVTVAGSRSEAAGHVRRRDTGSRFRFSISIPNFDARNFSIEKFSGDVTGAGPVTCLRAS